MRLYKGKPEDAGMSPERLKHVRDLAEGWVADGITPSLVVLAARKGVIVLHEAYGIQGPESKSPPLKKDAIFPLASITKPITAVAAMILVEDGLLGLNRPVSNYLPEFVGEGKDGVMLHHLLTHTSGLNDETIEENIENNKGSVEIPPPDKGNHPVIHELLTLGYDSPLSLSPGEEMVYCNFGYWYLGEIVRRVSGKPLGQFARERIFNPLGMKDTSYGLPNMLENRAAKRPPDSSTFTSEEWWRMGSGSGGAFSTAKDMAIFGQMMLNDGSYRNAQILSPASVSEMTRNQIPGIPASILNQTFPEASWGLGWSIHGENKSQAYAEPLQSSQSFSHGGASGVFLWVDPASDFVGVYFSVDVEFDEEKGHIWNADLFVNASMSAIVD